MAKRRGTAKRALATAFLKYSRLSGDRFSLKERKKAVSGIAKMIRTKANRPGMTQQEYYKHLLEKSNGNGDKFESYARNISKTAAEEHDIESPKGYGNISKK